MPSAKEVMSGAYMSFPAPWATMTAVLFCFSPGSDRMPDVVRSVPPAWIEILHCECEYSNPFPSCLLKNYTTFLKISDPVTEFMYA